LTLLRVCSASLSQGQGGPPLITDDTGTPGNNKWEINIAITSEILHPGQRQFEMPLVDINYGIGENLELSYEVPLLVSANRQEATLSGLGDSEVGTKWRFLDENKAGLSASIYPQFTFNNPTSSVRRGLVAKGQEFFLPLELQKAIEQLDMDFELGPNFDFNAPNEYDYGLVIGHTFGRLELIGEIHGTSLDHFRKDDLILNVGARYQISEGHTLLLSAGRSLYDESTARVTFLSYVGIQFNF
jgi:hypothetical protein